MDTDLAAGVTDVGAAAEYLWWSKGHLRYNPGFDTMSGWIWIMRRVKPMLAPP